MRYGLLIKLPAAASSFAGGMPRFFLLLLLTTMCATASAGSRARGEGADELSGYEK
jgi:hypothetical protein